MLLSEDVYAVVGPNPEESKFNLIFALGNTQQNAWENALLVLHPDRAYDILQSRDETLAGGRTTREYQELKKIWFQKGYRARKVTVMGAK